ncbi:MAG: chemotaxis protein CheW [Blastocatellia bacterium]|nr:chemotaxis protein CheW [Blastocatellia bacterium]
MTDEIPNDMPMGQAFEAKTEGPSPASLENIIAQIDQSITDARPSPSGASSTFLATMHPSAASKPQGKYIIFSLADNRYAVPINQVLEVGEPQRITPVPNVPDWVLGVTNLRGDIISVVDCGAFLNLHEKITLEMSSMCVVRNKKRNLTTSLMVDRIEGMLNLAEDLIVLPKASLGDRLIPYLQGVYDHEGHLLNVLNLEGLLSSMELSQ